MTQGPDTAKNIRLKTALSLLRDLSLFLEGGDVFRFTRMTSGRLAPTDYPDETIQFGSPELWFKNVADMLAKEQIPAHKVRDVSAEYGRLWALYAAKNNLDSGQF